MQVLEASPNTIVSKSAGVSVAKRHNNELRNGTNSLFSEFVVVSG